jgi:hypothetical protein
MTNKFLPFIDDKDLKDAVSHVFSSFQNTIKEVDIHKNTLDPFSAFLESAFSEISLDDWIVKEKQRQAQKTFQNAIGDFHQIVLGHCHGWKDLGVGGVLDVCSNNNKILAEIKNKHNTMNSGSSVEVYHKLASMLSLPEYKDYKGYCVKIIPKYKRGILEKMYAPSDSKNKTICPKNPRILETDGKRFYALATGYENAIEMLFDVLPKVIENLSGKKFSSSEMKKFKGIFEMVF